MPLPAPLSRVKPQLSKKDFGRVLIIAGSPSMLGAAALSSLGALRSGAGLVTAAVPSGLNLTLQEKISHCVMTMPLAQSSNGAFAAGAIAPLKKVWDAFDALAVGPGIGRSPGALALARKIIIHCPKPLVIDADALFALTGHTDILRRARSPRILTPHTGEMSRLTGLSSHEIEAARKKTAGDFARRYNCVLLLKGHRTVVATPQGKTYINRSGNVGMATAGSGDVLTGIITAFAAQGLSPSEAARWGACVHGKAGDRAARLKSKAGMIASDIIECIPYVLKNA
ncbi:MAG: NAD(P)H-hydrate dehydratase [Candidatus Omnitrophica bacterium]|nr:NAD(P)H-hydrate dehydratase [Candidatus Omnitrophota bacterium]MDE2008879.1 NAD(P)H-hydrate dehydratase [Candidatus Omnitrophota bacterium]MDE2213558.1 NAD(P)H-hydrate dehydratase [Candidatus Omnitrophota bacterium]MDE2230541.1 NAD(P)H-hydrate dehydratase [Candidatus Omnitrophota bacterium]